MILQQYNDCKLKFKFVTHALSNKLLLQCMCEFCQIVISELYLKDSSVVLILISAKTKSVKKYKLFAKNQDFGAFALIYLTFLI